MRARSRLQDALIEPIGPAHQPNGWICVCGLPRGGDGLGGGAARARLIGIAAQAATAIANAHLLDQVRHQALHDGLTGLPNRSLIYDRLEQMLARARRSNAPLTVLFLDLDGFKDVNDELGHEAGDELLQAVSARLTTTLRESDVVGRLGGDEFVVLSEGATSEDHPALVAERLLTVLREPFTLDADGRGDVVTISASVGSARGSHQTAGELLRDADIALYEAKRTGKNVHVRFSSGMHTPAREQLLLERDLRAALDNGHFELSYQPIFDLADQRVTGTEALLRWHDPVRGLVMPDDFIPTLERTGMIVEAGRWVLEEACRQATRWHAEGFEINVSVNISARQLDGETFVDVVRTALETTGLAPRFLTLEITETAIMRDTAVTVALLQELKELGVHLAIDDFGTGYSSLAYLQQFPVDALKIDRSFITAMTESSESGAIIRALVHLGQTLGLQTVAEGIEEQAQRLSLQDLHCDRGQGYLFARPLSVSDMRQLLESDTARADVAR